ncbi:uncharacterized protein [Fopius arisanus]|uniref:Uncharacterized protein isoform X1 n=1 Tax=Fopius arisanus TaxID=64838 RepID=A0A9R1TLJ5_9HYME|nr:PREDICTED: uncharacterized protein LOC105272524 isoform X1 [Fopius arisanus]
MESEDILWTENEEIASYEAGNTMMDIVGYIESVEALSSVKTYQKWIYKIILNNNKGSKVRVVFWKEKALEWSSKLTLSEIVEITCCTVADVKFQFDRDLKGVIVPQELHVQDFSTIQVLGKFDLAHSQLNEVQFQETTIEHCLEHGKTPIAVRGYVKNDFVIFKTIGQMSMANGNIVDGHFRLCVQIRDYKNSSDSKLEKGAYAIFYGKIDMSKPGSSYLSVDGMNKVIIDETKPKMPLEKLRLSFHKIPTPKPDRDTCNPKRSADDEKENSNRSMDTEKKLKND